MMRSIHSYEVYPYGAIELKKDSESLFKVNGQTVKHYIENIEEVNDVV